MLPPWYMDLKVLHVDHAVLIGIEATVEEVETLWEG